MAFNAGSILATLKLDSKQFTAGLKTAATQTKGFAAKLGALSTLAKVGLVAGIAVAGRELVRLSGRLFDAAKAGDALLDLERSFDNLAKSSGTSSQKIIADVQAITNTLTRTEIRKAGAMLSLVGVDMAKLPRLVEIASAGAKATGQAVTPVLDAIITGTARQNDRMMRQYGIVVDVEAANKRYAETLGKVVKNLTEEEQTAAFVNGVLADGQRIIAQTGLTSDQLVEKVEGLDVAWRNLGDTIKTSFTKSVENSFPGFERLIKYLDDSIRKSAEAEDGRARAYFYLSTRAPWLKTATDEMPSLSTGAAMGAKAAKVEADAAALAAEDAKRRAAEASAYIDGILKRPHVKQILEAGTPIRQGFQPVPLTIPQGEVPSPDLIIGETAEAFDGIGLAAENAQDTVLGFFADLASGSATAAEALRGNLLRAIGAIANSMGNLLVNAARGIGALAGLNPIAAAIAGFALLALSGLATGAGQGGSRVPEYRQPTPRTVVAANAGPSVTIHVDNFVGNKFWANEFFRMANEHMKKSGHAEVFFLE